MSSDGTNRQSYAEKITALHEAAREIFRADTKQEIAEIVVNAVRDILEMPINGVAVHDATENVLRTIARTDQSYELLDGDPVFHPGESLAWEVFESGEPRFYDDVSMAAGRANPDTPIRSEILVPLGDHGVLLIGSTESGAFDDVDRSLAETLGRHAHAAFDRISHERELQRQNDRLDQFVSFVSHDLRNPLNVAKGRIELAQEECDSEHLDRATDALDRGFGLIDDLLEYTREGDRGMQIETVDLTELSLDCWRNVQKAEASFSTKINREILADPGRLKQLLENLFRNAVEHSDGSVSVTVGEMDNGFYVEDNGPGIPECKRKEIFEPGYSTSRSGTGFGMSIVKQVIDAHNWNITITVGTNGGARFEITSVEFAT